MRGRTVECEEDVRVTGEVCTLQWCLCPNPVWSHDIVDCAPVGLTVTQNLALRVHASSSALQPSPTHR